MNIPFDRKVLAAVMMCGGALLAANSQAARLEGRVTDQGEEAFFGSAMVTLKELNLQARTSEDGRYVFADVPPGTYTLVVNYLGADKVESRVTVGEQGIAVHNVQIGEDVPGMENLIVHGQRGSIARALNQQRAANNIVDVISADTVGNLPDSNIAEALQRAPGVFIERDQGEGRYVGIRGLSPSLATVNINGLEVGSPDADQRAVALDVIPSDLLETLEVHKTFTADMEGDAIGGTVNVKSLSGFDRDGTYWKASAEGGYNDLVGEYSPKLSATYSDQWNDTFAVAAALTWSERDFGSKNLEHDGGWVEFDDYRYPEQPEFRDYAITRERTGLAVNLDWRPTDASEYYLRTLFSDFEDFEIRQRMEVEPDEDTLVSISRNAASFEEAEYQRSLKDRTETQQILSTSLGGKNLVGRWTFEYAVGYSYAEEAEPDRRDTDFAGPDAPLAINSFGEIPDFRVDALAYAPQEFELDELVVEDNLVEDEAVTLNLDISREFNLAGAPSVVKFGGLWRSREKTRESTIEVYDDFDSLGEFTAADFATDQFVDYNLLQPMFGFGLSPGAIRSFAGQLGADNLNADETLTESTVGDYVVEEDVKAAYIMLTTDIGDWRAIAGLRYELTELSSSGAAGTVYESETEDREATGFGDTSFDSDYDYILPSFLLRYNGGENWVARAALSQTLSRPSFGALNPSSLAEIEEEDGETEFVIEELGNADLDPYESVNFDLSFEYYPGDVGVLSAGLFYKDIDNFIAQADVSDTLDLTSWLNLVNVPASQITDVDALQFVNGGGAELLGLELAWVRNFDNGFMFGVNATLSDSDAEFEGRDVDLPQQAPEVGNVMLGYENYGLQLRLALNYKSEQLIVVGSDEASDVYMSEHTQLDLSVKYDLTPSIQVYFQGINLNDEPRYAFQDNSRYNWQYEEYGPTYVLGVNVVNF